MDDAAPRTAVVADRRPLERNLLRFLLEEEGFAVRAEAGTMADLLLALQRETPTDVVLHEDLAEGHDDVVIEQIRWLAPRSHVVVVTGEPEGASMVLRSIADSVVADGVGLAGVGLAVVRSRDASDPSTDGVSAATTAASETPPARSARKRWAERLQGAVAASIVALAIVVLRGAGTQVSPPDEGDAAAPTQDVGPLAPDRPSTPNDGDEEGDGVGGAVSLAATLLAAPSTQGSGENETTDQEPGEAPTEEPAPTPDPTILPTDPPTDPPSDQGVVPGPPAALVSRLKPRVQGVLSQLRPVAHGRQDGAHPGVGPGDGSGPTGGGHDPDGPEQGGPPPWAGGPGNGPGNGHGNGKKDGPGHGNGPPPGRGHPAGA